MSKMGNWVIEMQEDACDMTLQEFVKRHGSSQTFIWHEVQQEIDDCEQEYFAESYNGS